MAVVWTEEQKKVIRLRDRNILVSAAAGSGKTAVLVQRILSRILDREAPTDVDRLLIMTFTRAAAGEMRERLSAALEKALYEDPDNEHLQKQMNLIHTAQITTIDGFCAYMLRNYFHMIELDPGWRTADEGELKLLREDVMKELLEEAYEERDPGFLKLVECYAPGKNDEGLKDLVLRVYDSAMSHPFPEKWLSECIGVYERDGEDPEKKGWLDLLWSQLEAGMELAVQLAGRAREICLEPNGPFPYEEALAADLLFAETVEQAVKEKDFLKTRTLLGEHTFPALSRKKAPDVDPDKKELVKKLRDQEKEALGELYRKYLFWDQEELFRAAKLCAEPLKSLVKLVLAFRQRFSEKKREKNILDFTDMEHFALEILLERKDDRLVPSQAARELSEKYDEVMVDEYQDSNLVQEMITSLVSGWVKQKKNIFMVGDVKQSIYRFRLARPELFMEKFHSYSTEDGPEQRIDLHKNFRSRCQVLDSVNEIFRRIMGEDVGGIRYDEESALYPGAEFPEGEHPDFFRTELFLIEKDGEELLEERAGEERTEQELEALAIAGEIQRITGREQITDKKTGQLRPVEYGDIVILLRSVSGWAETFREVLLSRGIPAYTASRTGYFSALEVVTVLNYLRILDNPLQDIPLTGVLLSPIAGCTDQELALMRSRYPDGLIYDSLLAFVREEAAEKEAPKKEETALRKKLQAFLNQLGKLREMAGYTPVHQMILRILKETGYEEYVRALPGGSQRGANLRMLVEKAMDYEKTSYRGLFHFVRYIEKLQKYQVDFGEVSVLEAGRGAVQIMTVHKSKGLEFPVVFTAGMGRQFNFQDLNARLLIHPDLGFGADVILPEKRLICGTPQKQVIRNTLKKESLGEELRVLYVALTRAREKLYITGTIGKLPERIREMWIWREQEQELLPLWMRTGARCFWDYLLPALGNHRAMRELYLEYGFCREGTVDFAETSADFGIRKITASDLIQEEILDRTENQIRERVLKQWNPDQIYDQKLHDRLEERFGFRYPYQALEELPVKVSVSELKKRSRFQQEEKEDALFYEPDVVPLIPRFASQEQKDCRGAARGTAYHRVMECLDYGKTDSAEEIRNQLRNLTDQKKLETEEASCIKIKDICRFVESPLGQRIKKAAGRGELFREQPFVIAADVSELKEEWTGGEKVLVQGIIDAYFLEEDEIILLDYKTDYVAAGEEESLVQRYKVQLMEYAGALEQLTAKRVKEKYIYSFTLGKAILL